MVWGAGPSGSNGLQSQPLAADQVLEAPGAVVQPGLSTWAVVVLIVKCRLGEGLSRWSHRRCLCRTRPTVSSVSRCCRPET